MGFNEMIRDPTHIADITNVSGDTVTATVVPEAAPGLTFSSGHAYFVGQVGAYARIPLGLVDLFAIIVEAGSTAHDEDLSEGSIPGRPWLRLELLGEARRNGPFERGVARYPSIGDRVLLVTATDLSRLYDNADTERSLRLGHVANSPHLPAFVDVSKLVNRHTAVVGSTGSGKSTTVSALIGGLASQQRFPSSRILIIDVHGEYGHAFGAAATRLRVDADESISMGSGECQLYLPYWALPFEDFLYLALGDVDENAATIVQQLVTDAKREFAENNRSINLDPEIITADTPVPFSVRKIWMMLHEMHFATHVAQSNAQDETTKAYEISRNGIELTGDVDKVIPPQYKPTISSGANRIFLSGAAINIRRQTNSLGAKLRDPRYNFLFRPGPWDIDSHGEIRSDLGEFLETWLGPERPIVIADLSGVPNQILQRVVSVLLCLLYEAIVWARNLSEGGRERPVLIVLEEAHRYLNESKDAAGEIVERIVKEGRKFGVGTLIVSQRPSEIRATVLSQIGSFLILRLTNGPDRQLVRASLPDNLSGLFNSVPVLRTGEAIVTGEIVKLPTRVVVDSDERMRPDSTDPEVVGRFISGGWDKKRVPQDYNDVAWVWRHLTPISNQISGQRAPTEEKMNRISVSSSSISTIGYDSSTQTLEIEFQNGNVYQYFDVPPTVHTELIGAASIGQYFSHAIRDSYRYARL